MRTMIFILLSLMLVGCTLNSRDAVVVEEIIASATPALSVTPFITSTIPPTPDTSLTATDIPPTPAPAKELENCKPRADWPEYSVAAGDTLYSISVAINSSVDEILSGNCLSNPDLLSVGQMIRVPTLPLSITTQSPTVTPGINTVGTISALYIMGYDGTTPILLDGDVINFTWTGFPQQLTQAEFVFYPADTPNNGQSIGIDSNLSDGASMTWTIPKAVKGRMVASGRYGQQNHDFAEASLDFVTWATVDHPQFTGKLTFDPYIKFEDNTYFFARNALVQVAVKDARVNIHEVTFYYQTEFTDPNMQNALVTIGTDSNGADGFQVEWHIPGGVEGYVYAELSLTNGIMVKTGIATVYAEIF